MADLPVAATASCSWAYRLHLGRRTALVRLLHHRRQARMTRGVVMRERWRSKNADAADRPARADADWVSAGLAVQPGLGLLPKRWSRSRAADRGDSVVNRAHLTRRQFVPATVGFALMVLTI